MTRILLAVALVLLVLVVIAGTADTTGLDGSDWTRIGILTLFALTTGAWMLSSQRSLPTALRNLMIWVLIGLGLIGLWIVGQDGSSWAGRMMAALRPGTAVTTTSESGRNEVILYKSADGHYHADVTINGVAIPMLVDTGATGIALSWEDAKAIGLDPARLTFDRMVMTANGQARTALVTLDTVAVGGIARSRLAAGVAEQGRLGRSLLGMNYLETLSAVTMSGEELRLTD